MILHEEPCKNDVQTPCLNYKCTKQTVQASLSSLTHDETQKLLIKRDKLATQSINRPKSMDITRYFQVFLHLYTHLDTCLQIG